MNRPAAGRRSRPWSATGGRVRDLADDIRLDTCVTPTSTSGGPAPGTPHADALVLCRPVRAVAELAALLSVPVGVAGALVADLRDAGWVTTQRPKELTDDAVVSVALLRRVRERLRNVNVS
ncbi:DUF742 domain-containing protein [Streptomyces niveus]|uniref:DUF742 domain-containing protein n=1 Tax=Streptomyces niveus TaxID=193462 RepID=UPI0036EE000D